MKKIMTGVATCALLLSGCANNEILDGTVVGNPDGAIKFGVSTPVTRASELYNNGNFITNGQKFNIVADSFCRSRIFETCKKDTGISATDAEPESFVPA